MNRLLIFFFLHVFSSQAQTDSVRLVDIQSSECGGMYHVKPGFIKKETIGDTTLMSLFCSNNCAGYNSPDVTLIGDSVLITIHTGEKSMKPFVYYKVNGEIYSDFDLTAREHKYDKKYSRSDTVIVTEESHMLATCECCYTFELKVLGLDSTVNYNYFYNECYIDPKYKATGIVKAYEFPYFFKQPQSEITSNVRKILLDTKALSHGSQSDYILVQLTVDTISGSVKKIRTSMDTFKTDKQFNRKLKRYFFSISPINCIRTKFKPNMIREYWVGLEFNSETKELGMTYENGEPLSQD